MSFARSAANPVGFPDSVRLQRVSERGFPDGSCRSRVELVAAQQAATDAIVAARDGLIELSRFIHANPETALEEDQVQRRRLRGLAGAARLLGHARRSRSSHRVRGDRGSGEPKIAYLSRVRRPTGIGHRLRPQPDRYRSASGKALGWQPRCRTLAAEDRSRFRNPCGRRQSAAR